MLRIIVNNSDIIHQNALSEELETKLTPLKPSDPFLFDFQKTSANLYAFRAQDIAHELTIKMTLEQKEIFACLDEQDEEEDLVSVIACDFPSIHTRKLQEKVFGDDYLQSMTIIQFQLKILDQLLLFCENKDATHLVLNFDQSNLDYMEIYQRFAVSQEEIITERVKQTKMTIPADVEVYDEVIDFIDEVGKKFCQKLWREQKFNPAFREYLKHHVLSELDKS